MFIETKQPHAVRHASATDVDFSTLYVYMLWLDIMDYLYLLTTVSYIDCRADCKEK